MACLCHRHVAFGSAALDSPRIPFPEPGVQPHYAPSRGVRIEHLELHLSLEPVERTFTGEARYRLRRLPIYDGTIALDCAEIEVLSVEDGDGRPLPWTLEDETLRIRAEAPPEEVVVRWEGADPSRGLYFTGPTEAEPDRQHMAWTQFQDEDGHFVAPCHDHPGIKHPWRISLEAPAGYTLLSNGVMVEQGERKGRAFAIYEQAEPMPAYLFTAVAAQLSVFEAKWKDRPVRYLVPKGQEEAVHRAMGKTPLMIEAFSQLTGVPYPWARYDQVVVHDFIFGGMENIACTTMTDLLLVDPKAILEWDPEGLVAHELAHQWFGDLVTCQDWSQGWLNESWATFMEAVWWEQDRAEAEAVWYRFEAMGTYFEEHATRYRRPIVSYRFKEPLDVFDRHLYQKGSCVLWTLRRSLGEDAFWAAVKQYLDQNRHGSVHTRDFQRALEQTTGQNLDRFFDQWVHSPGHPVLDVRLGRENGLITVTIKQTQGGDDVPEVWHLNLRIAWVDGDGAERVVDLPVAERERTWAIPVQGEVKSVRVDPGLGLLAQIQLSGPEGWLLELLSDRCPVLAVRAAKGLLKTGTPRAFDAVVEAMRTHPFYGVRETLAKAIAGLGGEIARDALLDAMDREQDPRVSRALVDALGAFHGSEVADRMISVLEQGELPTWHLQGAVLQTLGKSRDLRARDILEAHLEVGGWGDLVAQRALSGLAATRDPEVLELLVGRTRLAHSDRIRSAAAVALAQLGDRFEAVRPVAVERLSEMCTEPGYRAQMAAIGALGLLRDPGGAAALDVLHRTAPDGRMRRSAYEALVRIRQGRAGEERLAPVRRRLEELAEENAKLRARLDHLEREREAR